jgi:hypothetical protein
VELLVNILAEGTTDNVTVVNDRFEAYPNPVSDILTLKGIKQGDIIRIFNLTGSNVATYNAEAETVTIDLTHFYPGIYFINANGNTLKIVKK